MHDGIPRYLIELVESLSPLRAAQASNVSISRRCIIVLARVSSDAVTRQLRICLPDGS